MSAAGDGGIAISAPHAAALAMYHAAARHLPRSQRPDLVDRVANRMSDEAAFLATIDASAADMSEHFAQAIAQVESVKRDSQPEIETALGALRSFLTRLDGVSGDSQGCECVIGDLIHDIEASARKAYETVSKILHVNIAYTVSVAERRGSKVANSPRFGARTESVKAARYIDLTIFNEPLSGDDLNVLAYVLFHELVCHAFQGAAGLTSASSGGQHGWSEGWMDMVALEMAREWLGGESAWSLLRSAGASGTSPIELAHAQRFGGHHALCLAKDAYGRIAHAFERRRAAGHPQVTMRDFSLAVNVLAGVTPDGLQQLISTLQAVTADDMPASDGNIALSCQRFFESKKLDILINDLRAFGVGWIRPSLAP